jgi:hypothetical protein
MIQRKILIPCPMMFEGDPRWVSVITDSLGCRAMEEVCICREPPPNRTAVKQCSCEGQVPKCELDFIFKEKKIN